MKTTLLSFLLCYYFIYHTLIVSSKCLPYQQSSLLQFKHNLTFDLQTSTKLKFWNENTACCNWSGVTCDNEGHVIGLDLSEESISGGFDDSSTLFSLQHLRRLNLAYNNFNSPIPTGFDKLMMLNYLNLSHAGLMGNISMEISNLTRLVTLDLSSFDSFLQEQRPTIYNGNLQTFLQNLTSLRQLYLDGINISAMGNEWGNALLPLRDLQELSMSDCYLSGPLDSSLTTLLNLSVIILNWNNFSSPVPKTFANFKNLTKLRLGDCGLIGTFPQKIFQIGTLSVIDLSFNYDLHTSFPYYSISESLRSIELSYTNFSGTIPNIKLLSKLALSNCKLNGTFPNSLLNLTHLTYLHLSHNNLSGQIPSSLFTLSSMESIDISFNRLNGSLQLDEVLKLRNLYELGLSHNNISIDVNVTNVDLSAIPNFKFLRLASCNLKTFPSFLINQSSLSVLDLSNNQIKGEIPNWIWKLQDLETFNVSHNFLTNLEGPFQSLTSQLEVLDLHNNKLQGSIPSFPEYAYFLDYLNNNFSTVPKYIGSDQSFMEFLSFSNNNLHGSIPDYLCNTSQLGVLDISFNNFSGTIPPCLIRMTSTLEALNVGKNILSGPIPDMFSNSCVVRRLNFHGNQLQGTIPRSLSHCSSLEVLDIGSNQIVDHFPCFLNDILTLSVLLLRNNKFHGSIECSENKPWKSIQIVDIAFNNFNGKLSENYFITWERMMLDEDGDVSDFNLHQLDYIDSYHKDSVTVRCKGQPREWVRILKILKVIDFSYNFFEGPIPESLMELKALYSLDFSNNGLKGKIPSSIGNLKQLESLDLSNNNLVGEIPMSLASMSLSFLSYLNLSFNRLVGKIPTGTQLQTFPASSFEGNDGLYGPPLIERSDGDRNDLHPKPTCERLVCSNDWNFLSVELGFIFGVGMIIGPIMFWKKWRVGYWKLADKILCKIFPGVHLEYETHRGQTYTVLRW